MTQISYNLSDAHEAVDQFLTDDARTSSGRRVARNILDADGKTCLAVILDPAFHRELIDGYNAWEDSQEPLEDPTLPPGYRPYVHSPNATTDRLLPTEPLHKPLAHAMFRKPYEDLDQSEQDRVRGIAIACLLRTTLDPDTQGAVPLLMLSHSTDDPENRQFWQLAYKTDVDGLFLRGTGNGFFGEEWAIVTGAGWRLASGWHTRDAAATAVASIARVLPYIDWMAAGPDAFTDRSKKAMAAVLRRHHPWGVRDDEPEPEPLAADEPEPGPVTADAEGTTV